jgi:hypothetical protein
VQTPLVTSFSPGLWSSVQSLLKLPYLSLFFLPLLVAPAYCIVPGHYYYDGENFRGICLAFLCGSLVGATEISSRYRDEQMKAILSPDGLVYILANGVISTFALFVIFYGIRHGISQFDPLKGNSLATAVLAGFGASAIMRTRLAVVKGSDNKDISIGPDIIIGLLLSMIDRRIDRWRAAKRQRIVADSFPDLKALGSVDNASKYLLASLLSFQNLSDAEKKQFSDTISTNKQLGYTDNIQLAAIGFLFLTVVGEENFRSVLKRAKDIQTASGSDGAPPVSVTIPAPPPGTLPPKIDLVQPPKVVPSMPPPVE